ncbi:MAG: MFS transporter [Desulfuromonadales bacterium]|nr:MFS transporter [Desulfuromonadales bacterium]
MITTLTLFIALFLTTLTMMIGAGLLGSLLSLRMNAEGFSELVTGLILSGFYIGLLIGPFLCPSIIKRAGHIRAFSVFAAINTATTLFYPLFISTFFWFICRIMSGLSMMGMYMVIESWLNDRTETHMRGRVFSVYMAMSFIGLGTGQLFLKTGKIIGNELFLVAAIFVVLSLIPVALTRSISPTLPEITSIKTSDLLHKAPMGLLGSLTVGMISGAFYSLGPIYAKRIGLNVDMIGYYMSLTIICGFLMQWPVGSLSDRLDRKYVLAGIALMISLACSSILLTSDGPVWLIFLSTGFYGGMAFTLYPVAVAHTNDRMESHEIIPASSALLFCYGLGACIGPIAAASFMAIMGPIGLYTFITVISFVVGITVLIYIQIESPKKEETVPYVSVPRTSPIITTLHPHSEDTEEEQAHKFI